MKIIVGMSGGVDSSTVAALLKSQGHEVIGVSMALWRPDAPYKGGDNTGCYGPNDAVAKETARQICDQLGIPFYAFDCSHQYEEKIIGYFRSEYLAGRTPNPCVRCNAAMKFGMLPEMARQAGIQYDCFATGHYARIEKSPDGRMQLLRATDTIKDQSYFLCRLSQEQLSRQLFPLGAMTKEEVRDLARSFGLAVADKHDSQDFYTGDISELIGEDDQIGDIVDAETGKVLGKHTGYWKYTIGQRKGLGVASTQPLYVTEIRPCKNQVVLGKHEVVMHHQLDADQMNWVSIPGLDAPRECLLKARSVQKPVPCLLTPTGPDTVHAEFPQGICGVAPGQAAVFYDNDILLGGGYIIQAKA